jgi:phosphopantothenate-cysteine ligase
MAVSDYRVRSVTSVVALAESVASRLDEFENLDSQSASAAIASLFKAAESSVGANGKISSNMDDMLLFMETTPKIISLFQSLSPQSTLVGFKLLDHAPHETLIDRGFQILTQNKCSFVLANDLRDVTDERHIGYLIDRDKNYKQYSSKAAVADAIVSATINERNDIK